MFSGASAFVGSVTFSNTSNVTNMQHMFEGTNFAGGGNIRYWNTAKVTDMNYMFSGATKFNSHLNWNTAQVTNMEYMFNGATSFAGTLTGFNVSRVTDMSYMFNSAVNFTGAGISGWNYAAVQEMDYMFANAAKFNAAVTGYTPSLTTTKAMFSGASTFNSTVDLVTTNAQHELHVLQRNELQPANFVRRRQCYDHSGNVPRGDEV